MSVKLLDNCAFYGYRVRRTVQGKVYQEYFSLKADGERVDEVRQQGVLKEAEARDAELKLLQAEMKISMRGSRAFKTDGTIRGISYLMKQEKSGNATPIFQLGISSEVHKKIVCTSVSISAYGIDDAWRRVVDLYCFHKRIELSSDLYQQLLRAKDVTMQRKNDAKTTTGGSAITAVKKLYTAAGSSHSWL